MSESELSDDLIGLPRGGEGVLILVTGNSNAQLKDESSLTYDQRLNAITSYLNDSSKEEEEEESKSDIRNLLRIDSDRSADVPTDVLLSTNAEVMLVTRDYSLYTRTDRDDADVVVFHDASRTNILLPSSSSKTMTKTMTKDLSDVFFKQISERTFTTTLVDNLTERDLSRPATIKAVELGSVYPLRCLLEGQNNEGLPSIMKEVETLYTRANRYFVHNSASVNTVFYRDFFDDARLLNFTKSYMQDEKPTSSWLAHPPSMAHLQHWDLFCVYVSALIYCVKTENDDTLKCVYDCLLLAPFSLVNVEAWPSLRFELHDVHANDTLKIAIDSTEYSAVWTSQLAIEDKEEK